MRRYRWLDADLATPAHLAARRSGPEERWIPREVALASRLPADARPEVPASWGTRGPAARVGGEPSGSGRVFAVEHHAVPRARLLGLLGRSRTAA